MKSAYTAILQRSGSLWIGRIEEIPGVNSQGKTRGELIENLRSALKEALEMNRAEAFALAGTEYEEVPIVVETPSADLVATRKEASSIRDPMDYLMDIYDRHVRSLEKEHWGRFVIVAPDGEVFMGDNYEEIREMAKSRGKDGGCSFKVGEIDLERLRL